MSNEKKAKSASMADVVSNWFSDFSKTDSKTSANDVDDAASDLETEAGTAFSRSNSVETVDEPDDVDYVESSLEKIREKKAKAEEDRRQFLQYSEKNKELQKQRDELKSVIDQQKNDMDALAPITKSMGDFLELVRQDKIEDLGNATLNKDEYLNKKQQTIAALRERKSLTPRNLFSTFFYNIGKSILRLFGQKTKLEALEEKLEGQISYFLSIKNGLDKVITETQEQHEGNITLAQQLQQDQQSNKEEIVPMVKKNRIADIDGVEKALNQVIQAYEYALIDEKKISDGLIARCRPTSIIESHLKTFLAQPTKRNLKKLEDVMDKNSHYLQDGRCVELVLEAKSLHPEIPRPALLRINNAMLERNLSEIHSLTEELSELHEKERIVSKKIESSGNIYDRLINQANNMNQENIAALEQCQKLLIIAKQRISDSDQVVGQAAKFIKFYLQEKIEDIIEKIPEQDRVAAREKYLSTDNIPELIEIDYESSREEIENILAEHQIHNKRGKKLTLNSIKAMCTESEDKEIILDKINALPSIEGQFKKIVEGLMHQEVLVYKTIEELHKYIYGIFVDMDSMLISNEIDQETKTNLVTIFKEFTNKIDTDEVETDISEALSHLDDALRKNNSDLCQDILDKITKARECLNALEEHIGVTHHVTTHVDMGTLKEAEKDMQSQLEEQSKLKEKINVCQEKLGKLKRNQDLFIRENLPPLETPAEMKDLIEQCSSIRTHHKDIKTALINLLKVPTYDHLFILIEKIGALNPPLDKKDPLWNALEQAREYYPEIKLGASLEQTPPNINREFKRKHQENLQHMKSKSVENNALEQEQQFDANDKKADRNVP